MELEWPPVRDPTAQLVWRQVLLPVAGEMRASATELAEAAVSRMQTELPQLFPDEQTVRENLVSTDASVRQLAQLIEVGGDPRRVELPPSTLAIARSGVQRHVALADLMRFYRIGQELVWQWVCDRITAAAEDADQQAKALKLATGWLLGYIDGALVRVEQAYEEEREAWLRSAAATRATAIDDILAERERDPRRASTRLRYDLNRQHVGILAWIDEVPADEDAHRVLGRALTDIANAVSAESSVIHPSGSLAVAGWVSRHRPFNVGEVKALAIAAPARGVRLALGDSARGLTGFRRTHAQACHARRVALLVGPRAGVVTMYRDVAVAALASADREHAVSFMTRVLGPLAADNEDTYRVAMTLAVYLQENRSRARAARRLSVHPNTVSYRVHQAETILGRSIDTDTVDLSVALALLPALPGLAKAQPPEL